MRAGCSASTFILVAEWEQYLHPGSLGHRLAHRKGPLENSEKAVRTTGLATEPDVNIGVSFLPELSATTTGGIADTCAL